MKKKQTRITMLFTIPWMLLALVVLTSATYAWFTYNSDVETARVTARTSEVDVELQISELGGASFRPLDAAPIVQLNDASATELLPVSTADLKTFVFCPFTVDGEANTFSVLSREQYYYHGRIFLRALGKGQLDGTVALYLDDTNQTAKLLAPDADNSLIMNAARLGLCVAAQTPVILRLSDNSGAPNQQVRNTMLNGTLLGDGMVLSGPTTAVPDPSKQIADYTVRFQNNAALLPAQPIAKLTVNQVYALDIYFYLEGCDPDCSDSVSYSGVNLQLALYGVLEEAV